MTSLKDEVEKVKSAIEEAVSEALQALDDIKREVSTFLVHPRRVMKFYRELEHIVESLESDLLRAREKLRELRIEAEKSRDKEALDAIRDLEERTNHLIKEFSGKFEELVKYVEGVHPRPRFRRGHYWVALTMLPRRLARILSEEVEGIARQIEETVERSIEEARRTLETATTVVSSIRLREEDARIIDELVDAGIFRSRSEAVAFFTHKGIEASREWLEKVKEQIERIKELRDEVRRELEKSEKKQ
ncbi:MAG: hypothetical protein QW579_06130 [Desulfurococcaceae archaeon]